MIRNAAGQKMRENINAGLNPVPTQAKQTENAFNAADQMTQASDGSGITTNRFDAAGNLVTNATPSSVSTYAWDGENRLTSMTTGTNTVSYLYDATGGRVGRIEGSSTNYFVLNYNAGLKNVLAEMDVAGNVTRSYIWGPSGLIAHVDADGTTTHYYHADEQGSTLALTDAVGTVTDQFAYRPYGNLGARTGTTSTPYQWLGGVAVRAEGGDVYAMQRRFYGATQKRWLSSDPIGLEGGANLYAYCLGDPIGAIDPDGLDIIYLNESTGFHGAGHGAALIGNDQSGWTYFSFSTGKSWWVAGDNLTTGRFKTLEDAKKGITDISYDRYLYYKTTSKEDIAATKKASEYISSWYWLAGNNCDDLAVNSIKAAGKKIDDRWRPNDTYKANIDNANNAGAWNSIKTGTTTSVAQKSNLDIPDYLNAWKSTDYGVNSDFT